MKRRRPLSRIHKATRLSYVMMLVGSRRDPPLASRAIAAMLVDHWGDRAPRSALQKVCYARENNGPPATLLSALLLLLLLS